MREKYLGDSYDIVKRFWADSLEPVGKLFAHPRFIPGELRPRYTALTRVPILSSAAAMPTRFGILMDPDTGIPLPIEAVRSANASHAPLSFIAQECGKLNPAYVICFDQSYHRQHALSRAEQREAKRAFLARQGLQSFYYVSHAPFLFASPDAKMLEAIRDRLVVCGVPECRLECAKRNGSQRQQEAEC